MLKNVNLNFTITTNKSFIKSKNGTFRSSGLENFTNKSQTIVIDFNPRKCSFFKENSKKSKKDHAYKWSINP